MHISEAGLCAAGCGRVMPTASGTSCSVWTGGGSLRGKKRREVGAHQRTQSSSFRAVRAEWQADVERAGKARKRITPLPSLPPVLLACLADDGNRVGAQEVDHKQGAAWICRPRLASLQASQSTSTDSVGEAAEAWSEANHHQDTTGPSGHWFKS